MFRVIAVICLTLAWPAIQLLVFGLRFQRFPPGGPAESLVFVPMGLLTAVFTVWLWTRTDSQRQRRFVAAGYLIAAPVALLGSLTAGLALPIWGTLIFGGVPLLLGSYIGFAVGRPQRRATV